MRVFLVPPPQLLIITVVLDEEVFLSTSLFSSPAGAMSSLQRHGQGLVLT